MLDKCEGDKITTEIPSFCWKQRYIPFQSVSCVIHRSGITCSKKCFRKEYVCCYLCNDEKCFTREKDITWYVTYFLKKYHNYVKLQNY